MVKFIILFVAFLLLCKFGWDWNRQKVVTEFAERADYPEIKEKKPTFYVTIKTSDSTTHIISYLPQETLSRKNFDAKAAFEAISSVEQFTKNSETFTFNPLAENGQEVSLKVRPRLKNAENFVYLVSGSDPIAGVLMDDKENYKQLEDSIENEKTFAWTVLRDKGTTSYLRIAEFDTFKYGLPSQDGQGINQMQQINFAFNIELWKRSMSFDLKNNAVSASDRSQLLLDASESLWNTFGQLTTAKQERVPLVLMKQRIERKVINRLNNRAYYPFDAKAIEIYDNAPSEPIIR